MFVLANIQARTSIEGNHIALVPYEDDRLQKIMNDSESAKSLINGFIDNYSKKTKPASLIIESGFFDSPYKVDLLVNFRNIIAICNLCFSWSLIYSEGTPQSPLFSDSFDFYPVTLAKEGGLINMNLAHTALWSQNTPFVGMSDKNIPFMSINEYSNDEELIEPLMKIWEEKNIEKKEKTAYDNSLFRSLETAYTAMSLPKKNFASIYELGVHISLFVSAIEILANPQNIDVKQSDVLNLLSEYKWNHIALDTKQYKIEFSQKNSSQYNLVGLIYKKLYDSRNLFLHGSIIEADILRPFGKNKFSIYELAPIVYRTALFSYLVNGGYLNIERKEVQYDEYFTLYFSKDNCNSNYKQVLLNLLNFYDENEMEYDESIE